MLFRNLQIYQFSQEFSLDLNQLQQQLHAAGFVPCAQQAQKSIGMVSPYSKTAALDKAMFAAVDHALLLCARREDKVLPAASVRDALDAEVAKIEAAEARKVGKKEQSELKDEIIFSMLPRAFSRSRFIYACIDLQAQLLIVDAASSALAEEFCECLREAVGSLPIAPWSLECAPHVAMTSWLKAQAAPGDFALADMCELKGSDNTQGTVRISHFELESDEVHTHLDKGRIATKLRLSFAERLHFVLDDKLELKQLKFLEVVQEQRDNAIEAGADKNALVDADFAILLGELRLLLPELSQALTA